MCKVVSHRAPFLYISFHVKDEGTRWVPRLPPQL